MKTEGACLSLYCDASCWNKANEREAKQHTTAFSSSGQASHALGGVDGNPTKA